MNDSMPSQNGMGGMYAKPGCYGWHARLDCIDSMQFVYLCRHICKLVRPCIPRQCYVMSFYIIHFVLAQHSTSNHIYLHAPWRYAFGNTWYQ